MLRSALLFGASMATLTACAMDLPDDMESYRRDRGGSSAQQILSGATGPTSTCGGQQQPPLTTPWKPVRPLHQNACDEIMLRTLTNCLLLDSQRSTPACVSFMNNPVNQACITCARSSANDPQQGPLVEDMYGIRENLPACVAAVSGDTSANGCGAKVSAYNDCISNACSSCGPQEFDACAQAADLGQCSTAGKASDCAQPFYAKCGAGALSEIEFAVQIVKNFCMP